MTVRRKSDRYPWYKTDAGVLLNDIVGLSHCHVGIYTRLMLLYWTSGNQLPSDPQQLRRKLVIATPEDETVLQELLAEFFPGGNHVGLDQQLAENMAHSQMQSDKARSRFNKSPTKSPQAASYDEDF